MASVSTSTDDAIVSTSSAPSRMVQKVLHKAHDVLGVDWWATIGICTIAFRIGLVPLAVMQVKTARSMFTGATPAMFSHLTTLTSREIKVAQGNYAKQRDALRLWVKGVWTLKRHSKILIWKLLGVPLMQFPVFIWYISATRDLINNNLAQSWGLHEGGMLWFKDLTRPDSTFILPLTAVGLTYWSIEKGWSFAPMIRNMLQTGLLISSAFILSQLPSGVFMYWIPSTLFGLAQGSIFRRLTAMAAQSASKTAPMAANVGVKAVNNVSLQSASKTSLAPKAPSTLVAKQKESVVQAPTSNVGSTTSSTPK